MKTIKDLLLFCGSIGLLITYIVCCMFGLVVGGSWLLSLITIGGLLGIFLVLFVSVVSLFIFSVLAVLPIFLFF